MLNGRVGAGLQILITGMIGWLIFTVHELEISVNVQHERIMVLQHQVVQLNQDINRLQSL